MFAKAASLKTYPETLYLWTLGWGAWRARGVAVVRLLKLRYFLIFPLKNFFLRNGFAIFLNLRDCLGGFVGGDKAHTCASPVDPYFSIQRIYLRI